MALPDVTEIGDLPIGVHTATLSEATQRFGVESGRRQHLAQRLRRVFEIAQGTGHVARFVVFGSFITSKHDPNDVDIFMVMDDEFDISALGGDTRLLFQHAAAQSHFGCSVFWVRRLAAIAVNRLQSRTGRSIATVPNVGSSRSPEMQDDRD